MSSEQAQAKDNGTIFGYGRPTVLTGAAPAGVAIAQNAGPGKSQCQHPGSANPNANIDSGRDQGAAASPSAQKWGSRIGGR